MGLFNLDSLATLYKRDLQVAVDRNASEINVPEARETSRGQKLMRLSTLTSLVLKAAQP